MFNLNRKCAAGVGSWSGAGPGCNPQGCAQAVHGRSLWTGRLSISRAVAFALALAAGHAHAATDGPALAQRAAEFIKQELRHQFEREAWERQRAIEQQQYERIDAMEQRQRRDEEQWRQDMLRGGMPPATRYRKPF